MGGENRVKGVAAVQLRGSSPRGRGKRLIPRSRQTWDRLIPAWAGKTSKRTRRSLTFSAHPRVGGENQAAPGDEGPPAGSSPRGRGKLRERIFHVVKPGLIPAWAGKTQRPGQTRWRRPAHPRVGGENAAAWTDEVAATGSSPRGRGKPSPFLPPRDVMRLIPAWAGKTRMRLRSRVVRRAHPRVGGENSPRPDHMRPAAGSSPRGRGKPKAGLDLLLGGRLIPAWAGKTNSTDGQVGVHWAHPRVGGENLRAQNRPAYHSGSSPRGRGKHIYLPTGPGCLGLIPAWAGKTPGSSKARQSSPAHPRVGGENSCWYCLMALNVGSSPRGRGKHVAARGERRRGRLIPAWAGKTPRFSHVARSFEAHPRVGGENKVCAAICLDGTGSSPRGRGKRLNSRAAQPHRRLIPAWAGKTRARRGD
mgnify:CR=1 FL=1